jgi:threonine aldolase
LYALDHHFERLAEDHANARLIAAAVAQTPAVIAIEDVQTNIVIFHVPAPLPDAATVVARALAAGVRVQAFGPRTVRATTHLDVSPAECATAGRVLAAAVIGSPAC